MTPTTDPTTYTVQHLVEIQQRWMLAPPREAPTIARARADIWWLALMLGRALRAIAIPSVPYDHEAIDADVTSTRTEGA